MRNLSLTDVGLLTNASLGAELGVTVSVTHNMASGLTALEAVQHTGRAGAVTPSKFSLKTMPVQGVGDGDGVGVGVGDGVAAEASS
jgi:hypothetical protein